jgi:predicted glycoside hydrolase/deacetylase ChbG (UPF0249 family)
LSLDSHQHVHLHPALLPVVIRVAQRFGVGALRAASRVIPMTGMKPALIGLFARRGVTRIRRAGLRTPDVFVGLADTGRLDEARLLRLVSAAARDQRACATRAPATAPLNGVPRGVRMGRGCRR